MIFRLTPTKDQTIPEVTRVLMQVWKIWHRKNSTKGKEHAQPQGRNAKVILALSGDQAMRFKAAEGHGETISRAARPQR